MVEALSRELAATLGLKTASRAGNAPPASAPAYHAYMSGHVAAVQFRQTFQLETAANAERSLKRAIELDPSYSDALADLGRLRLIFAWPRMNESNTTISEAEEYARKALVADPRHATAHAVMAGAAILRFRPLEGLEFGKRGVEADPNSVPALDSVADAYEALGLYESAQAVYGRVARMDASEMDPFVFGVRLLVRLGRIGEAEQEVRRAAEINTASPHVPLVEAEILMAKRDCAGAEAKLRKLQETMAARLGGDEKKAYLFSYVDRALALAQLRQGRPELARATLARYGDVVAHRLDTSILLTADLGMHQAAVRNIEVSPYYQNYRYLVTEPALRPLHSDEQFRVLLDKTYTEWVRTLAELKESLPAQPPKLPPPGEFLAGTSSHRAN
jgi:tetratricopeptide (TPR) repeat protein